MKQITKLRNGQVFTGENVTIVGDFLEVLNNGIENRLPIIVNNVQIGTMDEIYSIEFIVD